MHDCPRFKQPGGDNAEFWRKKLTRNAVRDREVSKALLELGWRQLIVWECALVGKGRLGEKAIVGSVSKWLASEAETGEISGVFG